MSFRTWFDMLKTTCNLNSLRQTRRRTTLRRRDSSQCFVAAEVMEARRLLSAGALDPTFGSGGSAAPTASIAGTATALAVYSNAQTATAGDVVAAGGLYAEQNAHPNSFAIVRYTANGMPDVSFGVNGEVSTAFTKSYPNAQAQAVAIQADGKIVAAGFAAGTTTKGNSYDFAVARYNVNGSLDNTFGSSGEMTTNFSGTGGQATASYDAAHAAFIQPDGKIVLAGITSTAVPAGNNIALARYNSNGTLDTTFGSGGKVITSHTAIPGSLVDPINGYGDTEVKDVALQADGRILVAGYTQVTGLNPFYEAFVARYNANGTLDKTFGSGGVVTLPAVPGQLANGVNYPMGHLTIEPSGEIVVNGLGQLALLHSGQVGYADGSLDSSFGNNGLAATPVWGPVALEPNGNIVAGGDSVTYSSGVISGGIQVARFLPNGTPDSTFGSSGIVTLPSSADTLALQPDGKIDLAGTGFIVDRLLPAEPQIGLLTASTNPDGSTTLTAGNFYDENPGASITQLAIYVGDVNGTNTLLGYGTQTSPGTWALTFSTAGWLPGTYTLFAKAEDNYGVFGDPFAIPETVS